VDLAHDGRGVARIDGKAVFIDGALPGERVRFRVIKRRRQLDEAGLSKFSSPRRIVWYRLARTSGYAAGAPCSICRRRLRWRRNSGSCSIIWSESAGCARSVCWRRCGGRHGPIAVEPGSRQVRPQERPGARRLPRTRKALHRGSAAPVKSCRSPWPHCPRTLPSCGDLSMKSVEVSAGDASDRPGISRAGAARARGYG